MRLIISRHVSTLVQLYKALTGNSIARGAYWSVGGSFFYSLINLLGTFVIAKILDKHDFGLLTLLQSTVVMVSSFAALGLGFAITKYTSELKSSNIHRLGRYLGGSLIIITITGVAIAFFIYLGSSYISNVVLSSPELTALLKIASPSILFLALDTYYKGILIGAKAMKEYAIGGISFSIINFSITSLLLYWIDLYGGGLSILICSLLQLIISYHQASRVLRRHKIATGLPEYADFKILLKFGVPALIAGLFLSAAHWLAQTMLAKNENGHAQLAVYGIMMQWFMITQFIPSTSGRIILPAISERFSAGDSIGAKRVIKYSTLINILISIVTSAPIILFSDNIMQLYGRDYENESQSLSIVLIASIILAAQLPSSNLLISKSRMWLGVTMNAFWAAAFLLIFYSIMDKGAFAVALSLVISYGLLAIWTYGFARSVFINSTARRT